jgi:hypothetical protein
MATYLDNRRVRVYDELGSYSYETRIFGNRTTESPLICSGVGRAGALSRSSLPDEGPLGSTTTISELLNSLRHRRGLSARQLGPGSGKPVILA